MRSNSRKRAVIALIVGALLCIVAFLVGLYLATCGRDSSSDSVGKGLQLEMQVGEVYDLKEYLGSQGGAFTIEDNGSVQGLKDRVSVDGDGMLHVFEAGIYNFKVRVYYNESLYHGKITDLVRVELLAHDYEFEDYKPVYSYDDLRDASGGKYILAQDLTLSRESLEEVIDFSGIFVNPEGYTITIADDLPLFQWISERSVVRGMCIRSDTDGILCRNLSGEPQVFVPTGLFTMNLSQEGVICDSEVQADLYGDPYNGFVGNNWGTILRCTFRGRVFGLGERGNYRTYAISEDGDIRDCSVYADGYRGQETNVIERVSVFHKDVNHLADEGNRVFDLSGEHEIDFNIYCDHRAGYGVQIDSKSDSFDLFAGCVAEFPLHMQEFLEQEGAEMIGFTNSLGVWYDAGETWFLPKENRSDTFLLVEAKYKETKLEYTLGSDGKEICRIYPAEQVVEIPEGKNVSYEIACGTFSPSQVTLKLAADTQIECDTMYPNGTRLEGSAPVKISVDIGASQVYEQREEGVYRTDDGTLCRYDGEVSDGVLTLPDGVTQMGCDVFGDLEFTTLVTNDLQTFDCAPSAEWLGRVAVLRFGADADLENVYRFLGHFSALKRIETEDRADEFFAEDGILYRDSQTCLFVPRSCAVGETITLRGRDIASNALYRNKARRVILQDVGAVQTYAFQLADCAEVVVRGSGTEIFGDAFPGCNALTSFRAEGKVSLKSGAFRNCNALEGIELNENYQSIAYDAVLNCRKFAGYTQEEGCEKFVLSDGVLFEEGKALLSLYWMQNNDMLVLPRGVPDIQLFCEQSASQREGFSSVLLNEDVQSISARGVPFINYELAEESTFLKAEQGILFSADGTKLLSCPKMHSEYEYAVPDTVTEIADYAFEGVENISFVALGAQTQKIGAYAFLNASLRRIDFGDSLAFIGPWAFFGADIRTVELPDSVQTLGGYAFSGAVIGSISLPGSLKEIVKGAFEDAEISSVTIPEGVISVGESAFEGATLQEVVLPESLLFIGERAFSETLLQQVVLGKNVEEVGKRAFFNCTELSSVTAQGNVTAYGEECFAQTPFLTEGKTAENGGIYLGNTLISFFNEGESVEVRYGTTDILSLSSLTIRSLKLPATLAQTPSIEELPYLEQLWLGVAPQGEEETVFDAGSQKFRAKAEHLYICFPKNVIFGGELGEEVYICYDGTAEEFAKYAKLDNIDDFYERVYYFSQNSLEKNTWYIDSDGNMRLRSAAEGEGFTYTYSYDEEGLVCEITGYDASFGTSVTIPREDPCGQRVRVLSGLCDERLSEVRVSGKEVHFKGEFNVERMYISSDCTVSVYVVSGYPKITYLFMNAPGGYFVTCDRIENIVAGTDVTELGWNSGTKLFYKGSPEMWQENVTSEGVPYAYFMTSENYPDDGYLYYYYNGGGIPVLFNM